MSEECTQISLFEDAKKLNNTKYTYKSSDLIWSSYELSLTEQRIVSLACKKMQPIYIEKRIKPSDLETVLGAMKFMDIKISVNEFKREYNIKSNNMYTILAEATSDLHDREIRYYDENGKLTRKNWVQDSTYDEKNNCVTLSFGTKMILDLLIFNGKYVALFFDMSQNIRSKYAFRLYEILKSYAYLGEYIVSLEDLKFMLAIEGAYENFAEFNRNVIKPNLKTINSHSDISAECVPLRTGRVVTDLKFIISKNKNKLAQTDDNFKDKIPTSYKEISSRLEKYNIELSSSDAEILFNSAIEFTTMNKRDIDVTSYIIEKIDVLDQYVEVSDVRNPIGFLKWAIEKDFKVENRKIEKKPKKLKFDNFKGRDYSKEEWDDIENGLLGWDSYDDEDI